MTALKKQEYRSTRGSGSPVSAAGAILRGIAPDGGLYVPGHFPAYDAEDLSRFLNLSYGELAEEILSEFLTDFTQEEIRDCVRLAYTAEKFGGDSPAPLKMLDSTHAVLELWHGPTCAFKDMALQILPHFLTTSEKKCGDGKETVILVATSGDTGKAALEGFKDVPGTRILVFYPDGGVSKMQKLQMVTQEGDNVGVCAVAGNFDDAQTGVKAIFTSADAARRLNAAGMAFSSANSINWGRLVPQIIYYFSAYLDLVRQGATGLGESINFSVPTGNFGNILAAYYARKMGLPVHRLICASNANNVLTDFIRTGVYDRRRAFYTTTSPSMDILVSSNLERLLYDLSGEGEVVSGYMSQLSREGAYTVGDVLKSKIDAVFHGEYCDDEGTAKAIAKALGIYGYLCDTHTAVALDAAAAYREKTGDSRVCVTVSTASPYKFPAAVLAAVDPQAPVSDDFEAAEVLTLKTGVPVPRPLAGLSGRPVRFSECCEKEQMPQQVYRMLGI